MKHAAGRFALLFIVFFIATFLFAPGVLADEAPDADSSETIIDNTIEVILPPPTPEAPAPKYWGIANIVMSVISAAGSLALAINVVVGSKGGRQTNPITGMYWRLGAIVSGILCTCLFALTVDFRYIAAPVDVWTLPIMTLLVTQFLCFLLLHRAQNPYEEEFDASDFV